MRWLLAFGLLVAGAPAFAQVQSRPTDPPSVTAESAAWYGRGEPVQFAGNVYRRAGAAVFFDGNRMVRSGYFNGVPLYVDTTLEPYSIVFVPLHRGLMQPYELPRTGNLAGTTGSMAPTFPVGAVSGEWTPPMAPSAPTGLGPVPLVAAEIDTRTTPAAALIPAAQTDSPQPIEALVPPKEAPPLTPADMQKARERVWIEYRGEKWIPAGPAIPIENSGLVETGRYAGFPVFSFAGQDARIFLPGLPGLVAPYQLKR